MTDRSFKAYAAQSTTIQTILSNRKLKKVNLGMAIASLLFVGISAACGGGDNGWSTEQRALAEATFAAQGFDQDTVDCLADWTTKNYTPEEVAGFADLAEDSPQAIRMGLRMLEACPGVWNYTS